MNYAPICTDPLPKLLLFQMARRFDEINFYEYNVNGYKCMVGGYHRVNLNVLSCTYY